MEYRHIKPYKRPDSYIGPDWYGYYPVAGQSRDSSHLEASNFASILASLGGETGEDDDGTADVLIVRDSHWAVGWVETLYVNERRPDLLKIADEQHERMSDYPVLDEDDLSRREWEAACQAWEQCSIRERVQLLQETREASVFSARRSEFPEDSGTLFELLSRD